MLSEFEYESEIEHNGVTVELRVDQGAVRDDEVSLYAQDMSDEEVIKKFGMADEYTIYVDGEKVVQSGQKTSVRWLEETLCPEVAQAREIENSLLDAGWDKDELDDLSEEMEQAVVQLYDGVDIGNPDQMVKAILVNASDVETPDDHPTNVEINSWVEETKDKLQSALDAVEQIEEFTDEFDMEDDSLLTDVDKVRQKMFDSDQSQQAFAKRQVKYEDGKLRVEPTRHGGRVVQTDENGREVYAWTFDSLAKTVVKFNTLVQDE